MVNFAQNSRDFELQQRAHSPQLDFDELSRVAAGLASEY